MPIVQIDGATRSRTGGRGRSPRSLRAVFHDVAEKLPLSAISRCPKRCGGRGVTVQCEKGNLSMKITRTTGPLKNG